MGVRPRKEPFFCVFPYMYIFVEEKGRFFDKSLLAQLFCCLRKGGGGGGTTLLNLRWNNPFFHGWVYTSNISLLTHPFC